MMTNPTNLLPGTYIAVVKSVRTARVLRSIKKSWMPDTREQVGSATPKMFHALAKRYFVIMPHLR